MTDTPPLSPTEFLEIPPSTIDATKRVLWYLAKTVAQGIIYQQFQYGAQIEPTQTTSDDPFPTTWRRFEIRASNTSSLNTADAQYFTIDVLNLTNGQPDGSWTTSDYDIVVGFIDNFLSAYATRMASYLKFDQIAVYTMAFNPYTIAKPFADHGAPARLYTISHFGVGSTGLPPQVSCCVTEETASRRHWGRFYLPTPGGSVSATNGRFSNAEVDAVGQAASTMYAVMYGGQYIPVVPTTWSGKSKSTPGAATRTLQNVLANHVDDVPDIIRRRRYREPLHRYVTPPA